MRGVDDPQVGQLIRAQIPSRGASSWPPSPFTLDDLLAVAQVENRTLKAARADLQAALGTARSAAELPNPTLSLAADHYLRSQMGTAQMGTAQVGSAPWLWGASLDLPLTALRNRSLQSALAETRVRTARLDYAERLWQSRREIRSAVLTLQVGNAQMALAQEALRAATTLDEAFAHLVAMGETAPAQRLTASVARLQAQRDVASAQARRVAGETGLAHALGLGVGAIHGLALPPLLQTAPSAPDAARLAALREQALLSRADVETALVQYDATELELQREVRAQYPQITLGPGYTYDHGLRKVDFNASLTVPLFNRNGGAIAAAQARRSAAGDRLEAAQATALADVDGTAAALEQSLQALTAARALQEVDMQVAARTQREMQEGAADRLALLTAELAANSSTQNALSALDQSWQAQGALEDALRSPLQPDPPPRNAEQTVH